MCSKSKVESNEDYYIFNCPHCDELIQVMKNELKCCIFRHAIYKTDHKQIDPHTNKNECDRLKENDLVYGCTKPFRFIKEEPLRVEICDYI